MNEQIKVGRRVLPITHPDKLLFPDMGYTKYDLISYYADMADHMMPLIKDRPLVMHRFVADIEHEGFYHKDAPDYFPSWIQRTLVRNQDESTTAYVVAAEKAVIPYLASQGCITPHSWLSRSDKLNHPDRMIFDLDPGLASFALVRKAALVLRDALERSAVYPYVMTTGSQGMHVVIPIIRRYTLEQVRACAKNLAIQLVDQHPALFTTQLRKDKRGKRVFIDYLRNGFGATAVVPYAVRALPTAPVATPIEWEEVEDSRLTSQRYTIATVGQRLEKKGDPWQKITKHARSLAKLMNLFES